MKRVEQLGQKIDDHYLETDINFKQYYILNESCLN